MTNDQKQKVDSILGNLEVQKMTKLNHYKLTDWDKENGIQIDCHLTGKSGCFRIIRHDNTQRKPDEEIKKWSWENTKDKTLKDLINVLKAEDGINEIVATTRGIEVEEIGENENELK